MSAKKHFTRMKLDVSKEDRLYSANISNKKTLKAMENIEKGRNLIVAKDAQELFRKLGI